MYVSCFPHFVAQRHSSVSTRPRKTMFNINISEELFSSIRLEISRWTVAGCRRALPRHRSTGKCAGDTQAPAFRSQPRQCRPSDADPPHPPPPTVSDPLPAAAVTGEATAAGVDRAPTPAAAAAAAGGSLAAAGRRRRRRRGRRRSLPRQLCCLGRARWRPWRQRRRRPAVSRRRRRRGPRFCRRCGT